MMGVILSNKGVVVEEGEVSAVKESLSGALAEALSSAPRIKKAAIINLINHIHFTGGTIRVHVRNTATGEELIVAASPEPCVKDNLTARWLKHDDFYPADYILLNIIIDNGKSIVVAQVETISVTDDLFIAALPEKGRIWNRRQRRRYPANNCIDAEIIQDNNRLEGSLKDFSCSDFYIKLDTESSLSFDRFDTVKPFFVQLRCIEPAEMSREKIIYSGFCSYVKTAFQGNDCLIVLAPEGTTKHRIRRENRNPRLKLKPAPKIVFNHPFLNKTIEFELADISSLGFAVQLSIDESPLMPGLFIQELFIVINGGINLICTASIVYQARVDESKLKYGFSILDMDMNMFNQLFAIICNADNPRVNLSPKLDIDSLWEFFFKSKFIYPKKYKLIDSHSNEIRDIYSRLYQKGQEIFAYITYQENGKILGHCSMIRAYQRTWLVQHFAAITLSGNTNSVGIHVLNQVLNYADTMFKFPSSKLDYLMFYYRPDNRFSEYFFGGIYKEINNPGIVSQDTFAYLSCSLHLTIDSLPEGLKIEKINSEDHKILNNFYQKQSGGHFVKSLRLDMDFDEEPLEEIYKKIRLTRTSIVYSLKEHDKLKAVFIVDQSDIGINMSELLNCIKIIVIDMNLSWEKLDSAINALGRMYSNDNVSVMIYPTEYLNLNNMVTDRYYILWMVDSKNGYIYNNYLKQRANPKLPSLLI